MIIIKFIKNAAVCCTCILIVLFSCVPAFATSGTTYVPTPEDLIDMGYVQQANGYYTLSSRVLSTFDLVYPETAESPQYPKFNPSTILPWSDMPDYVLDIARSSLSDFQELNSKSSSDLRIPFVMVSYNGGDVWVYVGYNLALGYAVDTGVVRVFGTDSAASQSLDVAFGGSVCYRARYFIQYNNGNFSDLTLVNDWAQVPGVAFYGSSLKFFSPDIFKNSTYGPDYYFSGANAISLGKNSDSGRFYLPVETFVEVDHHVVYFCQDINGFSSGHFLDYAPDDISHVFLGTFSVPTESDIENEKLDGIQDSLSEQNDILTQTGQYSDVDPSAKDELDNAESDLFTSNYNPDNFLNDFTVDLDGSAVNAILAVMDSFVQIDSSVFGAILIVLTLGVIALIFGR